MRDVRVQPGPALPALRRDGDAGQAPAVVTAYHAPGWTIVASLAVPFVPLGLHFAHEAWAHWRERRRAR